jgi:hypothetical protein
MLAAAFIAARWAVAAERKPLETVSRALVCDAERFLKSRLGFK